MIKKILISTVSVLALLQPVSANNFNVSNEAELIAAIHAVNSTAGSHIITFTGNVTLAGISAMTLPPIVNNVTINGGGFTLNGSSGSRLLMIGTDGTTMGAGLPSRPQVTISALNLNNGSATGGNGAGGGMGAGGALYVGSSADVNLNNVNFSGNRAIGGTGGTVSGGGGLGGNGSTGGGGIGGNGAAGGGGLLTAASSTAGGGYGGTVLGQTGTGGTGTAAVATNGGGGGGFNPSVPVMGIGGDGGIGGGGGGSGTNITTGGGAGGYGGGGGAGVGSGVGGMGGYGGGGGGAVSVNAGAGGFGGGGGGSITGAGGAGGFGGGGGYGTSSQAGFGAAAGTATTGGNGAGFGGSIFVQQGGTITYSGTGTMTGGTVSAGTSAQAAGSGIFIQGVGGLRLTPGAGQTITLNDTVVDQNGLASSGYNPPSGTYNGTEMGVVTVSGAGTVNLRGNNLYSGGTIIDNGAVLNIISNQNLGLASANLTMNGATLQSGAAFSSNRNIVTSGNNNIDNNGFTNTYSGVISGTGAMRFTGTGGQTNLTGANTFTGGVSIDHTRLGVNSDASFGAANVPVALASGGTVVALSNVSIRRNANIGVDGLKIDSNGFAAEWVGVMSGTGALGIEGAGSVALVGANTYTGGTTVAPGGTLVLGNGANQGSIIGAVVNNGTFAINSNTPQTIANDVSGTGRTEINGTGVVTYNGNHTATGPVNVNSGTLQLGVGTTTGTIAGPVNVGQNGTFAINHSNATPLPNISGTGNFVVQGTGPVIVTGASGFTGTTTINPNSTLQFGDGVSNGSMGGNIIDNGHIILNNATATTIAANISGTGTITQIGSGTTTLAGNVSHTGLTSVTNGSLIVNGTLVGPVSTSGTGTLTVNGQVIGNVGAGGAASNITTINGAVTGAVNITAGNILIGSGTLGSLTMAGTLMPGASLTGIGTLTVNGTTTFQSGSIANFVITPSTNDRLNSGGVINIQGGALNITAQTGTYAEGTRYTLLNSQTGISGTFSTTAINGVFGANILPRLQYNPLSTELILSARNLSPMMTGQSNFVRTFSALADANAGTVGNRGALSPLYDLTAAQAANAVKQFSGEAMAGSAQSLSRFTGQFLNAVSDNAIRIGFNDDAGVAAVQSMPQLGTVNIDNSPRDTSNRSVSSNDAGKIRVASASDICKDSYVTQQKCFNKDDPYMTVASNSKNRIPSNVIWGSLIGGTGQVNGNEATGSASSTSQTYGLAGGITYRPDHNMIIGAALSTMGVSSSSGGALGATRGEGLQGALYGRINDGPLYVANVFSFGWSQHRIDRTISFAGFNQQLIGDTSATALGNRLEIGYRYGKNSVRLTPFAALSLTQVNQNGFTEKDSAGLAAGNSYSAFTQTSMRSELGLQFEQIFKPNGSLPLSLKGQVAWGHLLNSRGSMNATYVPIPTISFAVPMNTPDKHYLLAGISSEWYIKPQMQGFISVNGEFSTTSTQLQAKIGLKSIF